MIRPCIAFGLQMETSAGKVGDSRASRATPHELVQRGSIKERARYVKARRKAATSPSDERRRQLGWELGEEATLGIDPDLGFARAEPGSLTGAESVIESATALIESMGHEALIQRHKKPMAKGFLPESDLDLGSVYMRFALSDDVVAIVSRYLGMVPILTKVDVWYSAHIDRPTWSSQLFHLDYADVTQLKLFLHCSDVALTSGPLTIVNAADSRQLAKRVKYRFEHTRVTDEAVDAAIGLDRKLALAGPRGTAHFVDTSRCFHFGSRVRPGAPPRQLAVFQYLTPYSFDFRHDHRTEAPFRGLATAESSERERLLLGAD
jgi:hypothetical protein